MSPLDAPLKIHPECLVADILGSHPQTIRVFLRHHMVCIGCAMANFDTLEDAARNYALPTGALIQELYREIESAPH
jgi:hybrid cluster-associated redox disulfide protein